jgi:hypothetical protein
MQVLPDPNPQYGNDAKAGKEAWSVLPAKVRHKDNVHPRFLKRVGRLTRPRIFVSRSEKPAYGYVEKHFPCFACSLGYN